MRLIIFFILVLLIQIGFINAKENDVLEKRESNNIHEQIAYENIFGKEELLKRAEDKQLEEKLTKKFLLDGDAGHYINTSSITCKNPTSKINTLDCIAVNMFRILVKNNLKFEFIQDIDSENTWEPTKQEIIDILKENSKIKYEFYLLESIAIRTNAQTHKRTLYSYMSIKSGSFYKKSIFIKLEVLDNGLYEVVGGFSL